MELEKLKPVLEALFAASDKPLSVNQLFDFFVGDLDQPSKDEIRQAIAELQEKYQAAGFELKQVASGFRFQVKADFETWVVRLWEQKPPRYSRALMETLALIAYRQPITRGEIEDIRGVSVSSNIINTLQERDWIKTLGHKEVPGRPALLGTTSAFLDYFNLKSLNELPTLAEIRDLDRYNPEFEFESDARETALAASDAAPVANDAAPDATDTADPEAGAETATSVAKGGPGAAKTRNKKSKAGKSASGSEKSKADSGKSAAN